MTAIIIRFLGPGRYHATPWGRHVNEGLVEWPPSQVRILRAIIAGMYRHHGGVTDRDARILKVLAFDAGPWVYWLPKATMGQARFYHTGKEKKPFVIDSFLLPAQDRIYIEMKKDSIPPDDREYLREILSRLSYLGRAESWAEWDLVDDFDARQDEKNWMRVAPFGSGVTEHGEVLEPVRLLTVEPYDDFMEKLEEYRTRVKEFYKPFYKNRYKDQKKRRLKIKEFEQELKTYSEEKIFTVLLSRNTDELIKAKYKRPLATVWTTYGIPSSAYVQRARPMKHYTTEKTYQYLRFSLASPAPPHITESLRVGEGAHGLFARVILLSREKDGKKLKGYLEILEKRLRKEEKTEEQILREVEKLRYVVTGQPREKRKEFFPGQSHVHAYFIPEDADGDGFIDHLVVYARAGIPAGLVAHVQRFGDWQGPKLRWQDEGPEARLTLVDYGEEAPNEPPRLITGEASRILGESTVWETEVPYVTANHLKIKRPRAGDPEDRKQTTIEDVERQIVRHVEKELGGIETKAGASLLELLESVEVRATRRPPGYGRPLFGPEGNISGNDFQRTRRRGGPTKRPPHPDTFHVKLAFRHPVRGPIALGYGAHMGLGVFRRAV